MERLTKWKSGAAYLKACFKKNKCAGMGTSERCGTCEDNYQPILLLAQYEDTGLTPEEITKMRDFANSETALLPAKVKEYERDPLLLTAKYFAELPKRPGKPADAYFALVDGKLKILCGHCTNRIDGIFNKEAIQCGQS